MKIANFADLHLNKATHGRVMDRIQVHLPFRTVDFMNAFGFGVDKCINEIKPDLVTILGDVYETFDPSNEVRAFFHSQIKKFIDNKIPVLIILGNHDICSKHHALLPLKELGLKNIKVIEEPCIVPFKDVDIMAFPYPIEVVQKKKTIREAFNDFQAIIEKRDTSRQGILLGHCGVIGAKMNEYYDTIITDEMETTSTTTLDPVAKEIVNRGVHDIYMSDLKSTGANYVFLGHFHKHQILNTPGCVSMYVGSMEKTDMSERDQEKGFVVYDTESPETETMGKCSIIKYNNCRPMIELKGNLNHMRSSIDKYHPDQYKDALIKLHFVGSKNELIDFSTGIDVIKDELNKRFNPIHIYSLQTVINPEEKHQVAIIEKEIAEHGQIDAVAILSAASDMIAERITDEEEMNATIDLAKEIQKEVEEE